MASRIRSLAQFFQRHHRVAVALQLTAVVVVVGSLVFAAHGEWHDAGERLRDANLGEFGLGLLALAAYYLVFVLGWVRILGAWGIEISYATALRAEMVSMLAKYIPGGVWTPAARIVAVRRAGITDAALVTASMVLEAGLSALAGVIVFAVSLPWVGGVDAPLVPLLVFGGACAVLLHPRVFRPLGSRVLRRFGGRELPDVPESLVIGLIAFYSFTWIVGGVALYFLLRSVGGHPPATSIAFLGGTAAVGAIVAVLSIFAPSGLGPREASMYGLMLAIVPQGVALGATVLNRVAITVVEAALLVIGGLVLRRRGDAELQPALADGERGG